MSWQVLGAAWLSSLPSANTRNTYRWSMAHIAQWCESRDLDVLTAQPSDINEFRDAQVADGYAPSTVALRLAALASFYRFAIDAGTITTSPLQDVVWPPVSREAPPTPLDDHAAYALADFIFGDVVRHVPPVIKSRRRAMPKAREVLRGSRCGWCGKPWDETFHLDHIVPIARGGTDDLDNLTASCARCNLSKGAKDWGSPSFRQAVKSS